MSRRLLTMVPALLLISAVASQAAQLEVKPKSRSVKVFTGTFLNGNSAHPFRVADGGHINIKNEKEGLFYRLSAKSTPDGVAEVTIQRFLAEDYAVAAQEDRVVVALDGKAHGSSLAPFQFALDGSRIARAERREGPPPSDSVEGACCIACGDGWVICCGVGIYEPGWIACCWIDTWCATCEVCAWWI